MQTAIQAKKLTKSFGAKQALAGVSFEVPKGSIFGFLGPNGAGKTTTIRCLMDFIRPDSGTVSVLGKDVRIYGVELKRSIGYLPAATNLYDHWTVQQHINFAARIRNLRVGTVLPKQLGLDTRAKVGHLSTGNRQKLMIVLALIGDPELLILDEPTKGLDPILQNQLYEILEEHKSKGGTVFMSSHNLPEVEKICDQIAIIREGKIVVEESWSSLRAKSIHHVSAKFKETVDPKIFKLPHVEILRAAPKSVDLRVKGDITPVVHLIGRHQLLDLEVVHASLEEIFLEMYK